MSKASLGRVPLSVNCAEAWTLTDGDGDHVVSWAQEPTDQDIAMEIMRYDHPDCTPFIVAKQTRVTVWEHERATQEQSAKAYKIFGAENEVIPAPVVRGKRKVVLR